ncbi:MAG: aminoacyl-tRNA hydrolase [Saprospiraceae bacterium]|nr:aminoacyl-tRNA hydrolase [Saprospiraceae bacterium]MDW8483046.1 aminoacyl-tRNA hydrolase [Saprospiraceae bacterium]
MKYLICGLGNIGVEYINTRHNVGFNVVDLLCHQLDGQWRPASFGDVAEARCKNRLLLLLKPNTYMNLSGKALQHWLHKEKIPLENSLVICDDLNLAFGQIRLRAKGSSGGHNGLANIQQVLGTDAYPRLRIGIGNNFPKGRQVEYVLGKWTPEEEKRLPRILEHAAEIVKTFVLSGIQYAYNIAARPIPEENS